MLNKVLSWCGFATAAPKVEPVPFAAAEDAGLHRCTPDEAKKRRKAYKRRKAAKAARRRNRK